MAEEDHSTTPPVTNPPPKSTPKRHLPGEEDYVFTEYSLARTVDSAGRMGGKWRILFYSRARPVASGRNLVGWINNVRTCDESACRKKR